MAVPRRGLAAWPIRRKLVALVAGPLVLILGAGLFFTAQSVATLRSAQKARTIADVTLLTNQLSSALNAELSRTTQATTNRGADGKFAPAQQKAMKSARAVTDLAYQRVAKAMEEPPNGGWSAAVLARHNSLKTIVGRLPFVRDGVDRGRTNTVIRGGYVKQIQAAQDLTDALARELTANAPDAETVDAASALSALAAASSAAVQESVRLASALQEGRKASEQTDVGLIQLKVSQDDQLSIADSRATPDQRRQILAIREDDDRIDNFRSTAISLLRGTAQLQNPSQASAAANNFLAASDVRIKALDSLVTNVTTTTRERAASNVRDALLTTGLVTGLAMLSLLLASGLVTAVARTVTVPMRRLRAGAVDAATVRLPAVVRQIERDGPDSVAPLPPVLPPGTLAGPETVEVAQAVDGLTNEAVRLATAQVRLRHALDEAFVSMSRRSQSMVEKQLAIIDELESTEEDPEQLRNLFRLDHLAARMRRYNDNLLVLAGSTLRTRSAAPVPIADVFRAATSEMEQYERVRLQPVGGVAISGPVAGGLVHLLAELLDNAAMYSPPTSPILLSGMLTQDGGLHLEITDSGVGIPASELADLNARLAMPGSIDTQVPSRMGLYVVARLAQRGGFTVRLSPRAQAAGTVAEVDVPASMVVGRAGRTGPQSTQQPPGQPAQFGQIGQPGQPGLPGLRPPTPLQPLRPGQPLRSGQPSSLPAAQPLQPLPGGRTGPDQPGQPQPGRPGRPGDPGRSSPDDGESSTRPTQPGAPLPTRSPAATGGMRLNPSLRLTSPGGSGPATSPRGVPLGGGDEPGSTPARQAPAASEPGGQAPAAKTPGGPGQGTGPGLGGGRLPSRRPGAALAANPLGVIGSPQSPPQPQAQTPAPPAPPAPPSATPPPPARPVPPVQPPAAPAARSAPGEPPAPRFEAPKSGELPRRTRGSALAGTPLAGPPSGPVPLNGAAASVMFGPGAESAGPSDEAESRAPAPEPPVRPRPVPRRTVGGDQGGAAAASREGAEPGRSDIPAAFDPGRPGDPPHTDDGSGSARPPVRPFAQPRPAPSRPPFRPGATGTQAGASAATAAAAAARARAEASGKQPGPGTGLFAETGPATLPGGGQGSPAGEAAALPAGPATLPGGVQRPSVSVPLGDLGHPSAAAFPPAQHAAPPVPAAKATPSAPPPVRSVPEPAGESRPGPVALPGGYVPKDGDVTMIGVPDADIDLATPIFDSISAWFSTEPDQRPSRSGDPSGERPKVIDLRDQAPVPALAQSSGSAGSGRWAALGDQQWLATNARAAAGPSVAGNTQAGLPRRQPGANLLPSAAEAAPMTARNLTGQAPTGSPSMTPSVPATAGPATSRPDAEAVRGRLGSYQRGLTSARRARHLPGDSTIRPTLGETESRPQDAGQRPVDQGGDQ